MTGEHVVFIKDEDLTTAYAMRKRVWDTMVQLHKSHNGEEGEEILKRYKVVAQGLSEEHAEALVKIMKGQA